jgi:hypothetical protein
MVLRLDTASITVHSTVPSKRTFLAQPLVKQYIFLRKDFPLKVWLQTSIKRQNKKLIGKKLYTRLTA